MKKFEEITEHVKIEKLVPGGQGIGHLENGMKGFFWNVLPGETVTKFQITKKKSKYFEAIAITVENPSNHRTEPKDDCYLSTSPWQIMDYDFELEQKKELLIEQFRQADIDISTLAADVQTDGNDYFYRNKMKYSLYWDIAEEKIKPAFHARGSHRKVPVTTSSLERPEIFEEANLIIDKLNQDGEEARTYQSLVLRANQNSQVEGGLLENGKPHPVFNNLTDEILGKKYSYSPNGFFQINLPVYEMALKEISKHIDTDNVLDLYSGVGTIGLSVASDKKLVLVEVNASAHRELEKNCTGNATPVLAKSEEALNYIEPDQTVIVDPPRAGCDEKLINKLLEVKPKSIIYLSCNPATQARDVKMLLAEYQIQSVTPYNFFPHTPHLENLVILKKGD